MTRPRTTRERAAAATTQPPWAQTAPIAALMRRDRPVVTPEIGDETLEELLLSRELDELPVVDQDGGLLGVVSALDLLAARAEVAEPDARRRLPPGFHATPPILLVADMLRPPPVTLSPTMSVQRATRLLAESGAAWAPIITAEGRYLGLVRAADLLRWLLAAAGPSPPPAIPPHGDGRHGSGVH